MYKLFLSLRYLRKRLIALVPVFCVMLCVFMVVVVISIMGGFLEMIKERSRGLLSDIVVDNASLQGFPYYQEFIEALHEKMPDEVVTTTPVIYNYGILREPATKYTKAVRVVGVRLNEYQQTNDFANSLWYDRFYPGTTSLGPQRQPIAGLDNRDNRVLPERFASAVVKWRAGAASEELEKYDQNPFAPRPGPRVFVQDIGPPGYGGEAGGEEELYGVIIGCDLINERGETGRYKRYYPLGSHMLLTILPMTAAGTLSGAGSATLSLRYADDSRTGVYEIDNLSVYVDFAMIQEVLDMGPQERIDGTFSSARTSQVLIRLADGLDTGEVRARIEKFWGTDTIRRANLDGTGAEEIVAADLRGTHGKSRHAIVRFLLDPAGGKLYWETDAGVILRANADGSGLEEVTEASQVPPVSDEPWDLADGRKYWVGPDGHIRRSNPDGSEAQTVIATGYAVPGGFELDEAAGKIYWIEQCFTHSLHLPRASAERLLLNGVEVETWQERQRQFIQAVEKEKVVMIIVLAIMSVVTVALIGCIFYMVVEKKIRDIGIIKSLGASSAGVAWIFLIYAAAVGTVGSVIGAAGGCVFMRYINDLQDWLASLNPNLRVWSPDVYTFDRIPNTVDPAEVLVVVLVAMVASMLGALIPALLAARVWPVNALRYE